MYIRTPRLILRPYTEDDAQALYEAKCASHVKLKPWMPWAQVEPTLEAEQKTIAHFQKKWAEGTEFTLGLFLPDGTFVGSSGFSPHEADVPSFEIGYWMDTRHEGKGYMTEAVKAQTTSLFNEKGANRVFIHCHADNQNSAAVALRLKFAPEARLLNARRHVDGQLADLLSFAHTPESWRAVLPTLKHR